MKIKYGRRVRSLVALATMAAAAGGGFLSSPAGAVVPESASFTMTSEPGDYIGGGQQYSYASGVDTFNNFGNNNYVDITVNGANGDWWTIDFAAPTGQSLAPGTYTGATRYPFHGDGPGLSIYGNGRGCNTLTGSFTVSNVTFGVNNYLQTFDASFEQHCEGGTPALRGQVHLVNPPAPQPLEIGMQLSAKGSVDRGTGVATVSGTVTCNQPTSVSLSGTVNQRATRFAMATGSFYTQVACSSTPKTWTATVTSGNTVPFNSGAANVSATASAYDPAFGQYVTVTKTSDVKLSR